MNPAPPRSRTGAEAAPEAAAHEPLAAPADEELVLRVAGLEKRYPGAQRLAVDDVSFTLRRGEVLGLLGPNGAGKTTTVEILTGFRSRTAGTVQLLGLDPGRRDHLRELRRRVGVVLQSTGHYRYLTVLETIQMHRSYHHDARDAEEVLALVGLESCASQRIRELSGGQQRRLDVGVALVGRPEVIFLDEPTTGFDPAARRRAWQVIGGLARLGTSVVLTTHYMEEAAELADRVLVLAGGRVVGEGTPADLARTLELGTTIRATLPETVQADDLPPLARAGLGEGGRFELRCRQPAAVLAELCQWAVSRGIELHDIDVRAPSLEDSYLALTGPDEETRA